MKTLRARSTLTADHVLNVWFTKEEYEQLNRYSHLHFRSKSLTVRKFVLEGIGLLPVTPDDHEIKCPLQPGSNMPPCHNFERTEQA